MVTDAEHHANAMNNTTLRPIDVRDAQLVFSQEMGPIILTENANDTILNVLPLTKFNNHKKIVMLVNLVHNLIISLLEIDVSQDSFRQHQPKDN